MAAKKHILVIILSCIKNYKLWENLKKKTDHLLIISGSHKNVNFFDYENKELFFNCNDLYDGLSEKIIYMIEFILNNEKFKNVTHIIKIDDHDTFFTNENIQNLYNLKELDENDYIGQTIWNRPDCESTYHFNKVPVNSHFYNKKVFVPSVSWLDGGNTYILSRKAMELVNKKYNSRNIDIVKKTELFEDIMIGRIMQENNIKPKQLNYGIKGDK